jgi:hypothetical protein
MRNSIAAILRKRRKSLGGSPKRPARQAQPLPNREREEPRTPSVRTAIKIAQASG